MTNIKLISADLSYNYIEPGDKLHITATFEHIGKEMRPFRVAIVADILFCGRHRREPVETENFRFAWQPFPSTLTWRSKDVWSTTGTWEVPATWGGSFMVSLSLQDEEGKSIPFIGKEGKSIFSQEIAEIDIGWGWGRNRLLEQRKPISVSINEIEKSDVPEDDAAKVMFDDFLFRKSYPAIVGYKKEKWLDLMSVVTARYIANNTKYVFVGDQNINYNLEQCLEDKIVYHAENEICSFCLCIQKVSSVITIQLTEVVEKEGYELIDVEIPSLIQLCDESGTMVNYFGGGRQVQLKHALPQSVLFYYDACNAVGTCSKNGSFAVIANDVDNVFTQSVVRKNAGSNHGVIGVVIRNRIQAERAGMKSIPVEMRQLEIHHSPQENWKLSAEILREKMPERPSKIYDNVLIYKIALDTSGQYNPLNPATYSPILTLSDVKNLIMQVYHLSQGMRQVVYLVGWQKGGHDFEYPYPHLSGFNEKCGTLKEFRKLCEECRQYNVELSLHDNFDDAYLSENYEINPEILAMDEHGNTWKGWLWAGGMSYILSPVAYVKSDDIKERIRFMISDYGISRTYHLDVLTSEVRRYSFAERELSCAQQNIDAKNEIIRMFNQQDIDITSETLAFPFIGKVGYAQNTRYKFENELFVGERVLPLTTLAFHGVTPYKMGANGEKRELLHAIACGASCSLEVEGKKEFILSTRDICRSIYLVSVPMNRLSYRKATNAQVDGNAWTVEFGEGNVVTVDFEQETYTIVCEGVVLSKNFTTFAPIDSGRYCYYSIYEETTKLNLPEDWEKILVSSILADGSRNDTELERKNGDFILETNSDIPYIIRKI